MLGSYTNLFLDRIVQTTIFRDQFCSLWTNHRVAPWLHLFRMYLFIFESCGGELFDSAILFFLLFTFVNHRTSGLYRRKKKKKKGRKKYRGEKFGKSKRKKKNGDRWCGSLCPQTDFSSPWLHSDRSGFYLRILQMVVCHRANSRSLRHRYNCFPDRAAIGAEILLLLFTMKLKKPRVRCWWQNELV